MFISKLEKKHILDQINALAKDMSIAASEITVLKGKLKAAEGNIFVLKQEAEFKKAKQKPKKPKKVLTPEQKLKQREYMKKYIARKKAEKAAKLAQVIA